MQPTQILLAGVGALGLACAVLFIAGPTRHQGRPEPQVGAGRARQVKQRLLARAPSLAGAGGAGLLAYLLIGLVAPAMVTAVLGWAASGAFRRWRESRRAAAVSAALVSAVDLLAQLLPAGHSTRQSLVVLAESGPGQLRGEITHILARLTEVPLEQALIEGQETMRQPLFTLIASALIVGNRSGGRLAPLLQELSRAAHQVDSVQGQLRAEQAQGRLGALVIAVMPLGLLALLHVVNPQYLAPYETVSGEFVLGGLVALIAVGYLWMVHILRVPQPDLLPLAPQADRSASKQERAGRNIPPLPTARLGDRAFYPSGPESLPEIRG